MGSGEINTEPFSGMSVAELSKEFWEFRLRNRPEFAIFKGILPSPPQLDPYTSEAFTERKV